MTPTTPMTQMTHPLTESPEHVEPLEVSPRYSIIRALGLLAVVVGVLSLCALPYGYLTISHGSWNAHGGVPDFRPILLGLYLTAALSVSVLAIAAGIASGAGKPWSRAGMLLYADLSIVLAVVGVLPVYFFIIRTPEMDWGLRHAIELLVILKMWIVELPLSIVILYRFTRPNLIAAYQHPELQAPDRSQR